jgi:hypothetical protein
MLPRALAAGDAQERLVAALGGYLEAVRSDPATWRLVLMPHEGAPGTLHEHISRGRAAVVEQLTAALGAGPDAPVRTPDAELTARLLTAFADEAARLMLAEPERYPAERILGLARWFLGRLAPVPPV